MLNFLVWGLIPLSIFILELILSEVLGRSLIEDDGHGQFNRFDPAKWATHESTLLLVSTALVLSAVIFLDQCTTVQLSGNWKLWAQIIGGFGFFITPFYVWRMFFKS